MSSDGDPDPLEEPGSPSRIEDQPDFADNIERDLLAALGAEMDVEHQPAPPPSPSQDNEPQPEAAVDAPSQGSSPGSNAAAVPDGANEPEDRDNGPGKQDKDAADSALEEEDDGTEYMLPDPDPEDSDLDTDALPDHDSEVSDLDSDILDEDADDKGSRSRYSVPALLALARRLRHSRNVFQQEMEQRDVENNREAEERRKEIKKLGKDIKELEARLQRREDRNRPVIPWQDLLRDCVSGFSEYTLKDIFQISCRQLNMSKDPTNVHPDLCWAAVANQPNDAEEQNNDPVEPADGENETSLGENEAESAVVIDDIAEVEADANIEDPAVGNGVPEIRDFPFDRLPFKAQQRIMEYVFVKPGVIHCLSRLDGRSDSALGGWPYRCSGTSGLPHRFSYGTKPWSIEESPRPDLELQPLLVSKRWLYLGVHAFYGLNTFAFSSLGEFGRFFNGIGPQRTQRVAHVELHWQGSLMRAHPSRINQRTLPLNHLTRMRRLQTVTLFIEEFAERRVRRPYEFPKIAKEGEKEQQDGGEQAAANSSRRREEYDFSARYKDWRREPIDELGPPNSLLKRTATHANWRGNRSMRTTHGMDYIYALRGLQWVRAYEHGPERKLIRDFTFLDDVNKAVTLPKDQRHQVEADLRNLIRPKGNEFYIAGNEDAAMVARWYELGALPTVHGGSDAASNTSQSDLDSSMGLDDPASPVRAAMSESHGSDDDCLDLINRMVFPDEIGYQHNRGQLYTPAPTRHASPVSEDEDEDVFMIRGLVLPDEPGYQHEPMSDDAMRDASEDDNNSDDELEALIRNLVLPDESDHEREPAHEPDSDVSISDADSEDATPTIFTTANRVGSVRGTSPSELVVDVPQIRLHPAEKDQGDKADDDDGLFVDDEKSSAPKPSHQFLRPSVPASALGRAKSEAIDLTGDDDDEEEDMREREKLRMSSPSYASTDVSGSMYAQTVVGTERSFKRESTAGGEPPGIIDLTADDDDDDGEDDEAPNANQHMDGAGDKLPFAPPTNIIYDDDRNDERAQSVDGENGNKTPRSVNGRNAASSPDSAGVNNEEGIPKPDHNNGNDKTPDPTSPVTTSFPKRSLEKDDDADIQDNADSQDEAKQEDRRRTKSPDQPQPKRRKGVTGFILSPSPPLT